MPSFLRAALLFALGLYGGVGAAIVIAGPAVFRALDSRTAAGDAFAAVLRGTRRADVAIGVTLAIIAALWLPRAPAGARRAGLAGAVALMLAIIGYYTFALAPEMDIHRAHISTFDTVEVSVPRATFDELHQRYVRVYTTNLLVCLAAFLLATALPAAPAAAPPPAPATARPPGAPPAARKDA